MSVINEIEIHDLISEIVLEQVRCYSQKGHLEPAEINSMERLAKIYAILMTQARENQKAGIFDKLTEEERTKIRTRS